MRESRPCVATWGHLLGHPTVFLERLGKDEDIVQVNYHDARVNEVTEQLVHHRLERSGRVGESEEHDRWLE